MTFQGIFRNSYVMAALIFVVLCVIFYMFEIGSSVSLENGKAEQKFSWKYPLALSLISWVILHIYVVPPKKEKQSIYNTQSNSNADTQKINAKNWY